MTYIVDPLQRLELRIMAARCHQLNARLIRSRDGERAAEKLLNVALEHWSMLRKRNADQAAQGALAPTAGPYVGERGPELL